VSALIIPTTGSGSQVLAKNPVLQVPLLHPDGVVDGGFWLDGNSLSQVAFFGMDLGGNTVGRFYSAALPGNFITWDLTTGVVRFPKNTGVSYSAYAAGTVYTMTASDALLDFGTTDPSITIATAGTYLLFARANLKYNTATYAANQTATVHLRRTNNTPADLATSTTTTTLRIITTITDDIGNLIIPFATYTTTNTTDVIQMFGSVSATPSAGSVQATEASITALLLV
jgi:hypothetical protein